MEKEKKLGLMEPHMKEIKKKKKKVEKVFSSGLMEVSMKEILKALQKMQMIFTGLNTKVKLTTLRQTKSLLRKKSKGSDVNTCRT